MSIIINGMDMPKGNSVKNLLIYSDGRVFTGHKDDAIYSAEELETGEWIPVYFDNEPRLFVCSECDARCMRKMKCCPNCGSYNGCEQEDAT